MSAIEYLWRLPTHGDGRRAHDKHTRGEWNSLPRELRKAPGVRGAEADGFGYIDYLSQVARAAEISGFDGALVPTGAVSYQAWTVAAALARETRRLRFLVAHQAGYTEPHFLAQTAATLQQITGGRVDINWITGGDSGAQRQIGDFLDHGSRYARTGELLEVMKGYWKEAPYTHEGDLYQIEAGGLRAPLRDTPLPGAYLVGSSDAAIDVVAQHADVYLVWAEPLAGNQEQFAKVREAARKRGRENDVRFGVRVDIIARETDDEAWAEARSLYDTVTSGTNKQFAAIGRGKQTGSKESAGAQRQWLLHKGNPTGSFDELIVGPNLWAGFSQLRGGPSCGLIGGYRQIAERLAEYIDIGASSFILASNPHLEEAYRVGEEVLPLVPAALEKVRARRASSAA
jgi:alkanesulfonate monooxygenase